MKLGINIDHVVTLREARGTTYPEPAVAAILAESAGCSSIVAHLREDRRHIKEEDIIFIKEVIKVPLNLEMSINKDIVAFASRIKPYQTTLVPERRLELTTEGGLNLLKDYKKIEKVIKVLKDEGIKVSLFIDPNKRQIERAKKIGANLIEINAGRYSNANSSSGCLKVELAKVKEAAKFAKKQGFFVAAGHGLDYENVKRIAKIKEIEELNIGHAIICHSIFMGIVSAVEEMLSLIKT